MNYVKYILNRVNKDIKRSQSRLDYVKIDKLFNLLLYQENIYKNIYYISNIKSLKSISNYLLFILKKQDTGLINFENLLQNLKNDKEFLERELVKNFILPQEKEENIKSQNQEKIKDNEEITQKEKLLSEAANIFRVIEKENELIAVEFTDSEIEKDVINIYSETTGKRRLELLKIPTEKNEDDIVYALPGDEKIIDTNENKLPIEKKEEKKLILSKTDAVSVTEDVYLPPGKHEPEETEVTEKTVEDDNMQQVFTKTEDIVNAPEQELITAQSKTEQEQTFTNKNTSTETIGKPKEELKTETENEESPESEKPAPQKIEQDHEIQFVEDIKASEEEIYKYTNEQTEEEREEPQKILLDSLPEDEPSYIEAQRLEINKDFIYYEEQIIQRNKKLRELLAESKELLTVSADKFTDKKITEKESELVDGKLLEEIFKESELSEQESQKFSFEIITKIYGTIKKYFNFIKLLNEESIKSFLLTEKTNNHEKVLDNFIKGLILIDCLLKDEDCNIGIENVIRFTEEINSFLKKKEDEFEKKKTVQKSKKEIEKQLKKRFTETTQREKLILLKNSIVDIEKIIKSLEHIKGEFQVYNGLRELSHTFVYFKGIVTIANLLEMNKLSQLAEGGYIFIKFVQSYRLNPFNEEIKSILNYIIYNMKMLFLDKTSKDIDTFIYYLNNPVEIKTICK